MTPHPAVGVIGLGAAGLALARSFAVRGRRVIGYDDDPLLVGRLRVAAGGWSPPPAAGVEPATDPGRLAEPDDLVVCVPARLTPAGWEDAAALTAAAGAVGRRVRPGQLVVFAGDGFPGLTRHVLVPALQAGGRAAGRDFFVAHSPDGVGARPPAPRLVGGLDPPGLARAVALFGGLEGGAVGVPTLEAAEWGGLLAAAHRAVAAALADELKAAFGGAGSDFRAAAAAVGPGAAPRQDEDIGPAWLGRAARRFGRSARLLDLAVEAAAGTPARLAAAVADALNDAGKPVRGSRVAVVGLAATPGGGWPGLAVLDLLRAKGAGVSYHDPLAPPAAEGGPPAPADRPLTPEHLAAQDCVLILADLPSGGFEVVVRHARLVLDARGGPAGGADDSAKVVRV